jgi:hypothetical protein
MAGCCDTWVGNPHFINSEVWPVLAGEQTSAYAVNRTCIVCVILVPTKCNIYIPSISPSAGPN